MRKQFSIYSALCLTGTVCLVLGLYCQFYEKAAAKAASESARRTLIDAGAGGSLVLVQYSHPSDVPQYDGNGQLLPKSCGPEFTFYAKSKKEISKLVPTIKSLQPSDPFSHVAIFIRASHYSDNQFRSQLETSLPNCKIFSETEQPGYRLF